MLDESFPMMYIWRNSGIFLAMVYCSTTVFMKKTVETTAGAAVWFAVYELRVYPSHPPRVRLSVHLFGCCSIDLVHMRIESELACQLNY